MTGTPQISWVVSEGSLEERERALATEHRLGLKEQCDVEVLQ